MGLLLLLLLTVVINLLLLTRLNRLRAFGKCARSDDIPPDQLTSIVGNASS